MTTKTHLAVPTIRFGEQTNRSLCGRSSGWVFKVETIENGQNLGTADQVTCTFCLRLMAAQAKLKAAKAA